MATTAAALLVCWLLKENAALLNGGFSVAASATVPTKVSREGRVIMVGLVMLPRYYLEES